MEFHGMSFFNFRYYLLKRFNKFLKYILSCNYYMKVKMDFKNLDRN